MEAKRPLLRQRTLSFLKHVDSAKTVQTWIYISVFSPELALVPSELNRSSALIPKLHQIAFFRNNEDHKYTLKVQHVESRRI